MKQNIVTITFFRFSSFADKYWAFKMMQLSKDTLASVPGLSFFKVLGTGGGNAFQFYPNFKVYGLLGVWEKEKLADEFFEHHNLYQEYVSRSKETKTYYMLTKKAHGKWSGINPFKINDQVLDNNRPLAVITRARIRTGALLEFWKKVPSVSDALLEAKGKIFSIGIGEWPVIQQATFSLWPNEDKMKEAIYHNKHHDEVIRLTRSRNWYTEELFARFVPYRESGSWQGMSNLLTLVNEN